MKALLKARKAVDIVDLLRDLYELSEENRDFIRAKLERNASTFQPYLDAVEDALYPDIYRNQPVRLGDARRAIAAYKRATRDAEGTLELMLRFVECGTDFTAECGDIDERFYSSLSGMFDKIVEELGSLPLASQRPHLERLSLVVERAGAVGWGYQDYIADVLHRAFPESAQKIQRSDA